jgi:hypothetical protein
MHHNETKILCYYLFYAHHDSNLKKNIIDDREKGALYLPQQEKKQPQAVNKK